jgi:hypothetical protein
VVRRVRWERHARRGLLGSLSAEAERKNGKKVGADSVASLSKQARRGGEGWGSDSSTTRTRRRRVALPLGPETGVCVGCAWRTWAGGFGPAREHCAVSDLIQYFQTELNLIQLKDGPPKLEKFQIKYVLEGILIGNNFPYRIFFSKFELEFELKFKEALEFEFQ